MGIIASLIRLFARPEGDAAPARLPSPNELALVARPGGELNAQLMRQVLAAEDITAMVKNRDPISAESGGMGPPWAYELWVLRRDLLRARQIIRELEAEPAGEVDDAEEGA